VALLNGVHGTAWANLGLWRRGRDYPRAAAALATRVGEAAGLGPDTRLLDVGVGAGEQLVHWAARFGVRRVTGVEVDPEMARRARERVAGSEGPEELRIVEGDASQLCAVLAPPAGAPPAEPFDAVVALDCAYHFDPRDGFLRAAAGALRPGGRLALTDLVVEGAGHGLEPLARRAGIPPGNLVSEARYREELDAAGLTEIRTADLTDPVLGGFATWALGRAAILILGGGRAGAGIVATAAAGIWARRRGVRYRLLSAVRRGT
jgi:microcystin synthetase protein McyJ